MDSSKSQLHADRNAARFGSQRYRFCLLSVLALILTASVAAHGKEWKAVDYRDSIVRIQLDWPWAALERGSYADVWSDDYSLHSFVASWIAPPNRLQIAIYRLAGGHYWSEVGEIDEANLKLWNYLGEEGMGDFRGTPCAAGKCLNFETGGRECVGFKFATGSTGKRAYGDQGSEVVQGYFCSDGTFAADSIDRLLGAILIRKNGFPETRN